MSSVLVRNMLKEAKKKLCEQIDDYVEAAFKTAQEKGYIERADVRFSTKMVMLLALDSMRLELINNLDINDRILYSMIFDELFRMVLRKRKK